MKIMSKLLAVGTVAFDAIETPFGKTDKILGGSGTFVGLAASKFGVNIGIVSAVGGDFPQSYLDMMNDNGINTDGIEIIKEGKTFRVDLNDFSTREEYFGIMYSGEINISKSGDYTFFLSSNDGSHLYIDDKLVIDNDGLHGTIEKPGDIKLSAGKHKFRLSYFQGGGITSLDIQLSGPDNIKKQIPVSMLFPAE